MAVLPVRMPSAYKGLWECRAFYNHWLILLEWMNTVLPVSRADKKMHQWQLCFRCVLWLRHCLPSSVGAVSPGSQKGLQADPLGAQGWSECLAAGQTRWTRNKSGNGFSLLAACWTRTWNKSGPRPAPLESMAWMQSCFALMASLFLLLVLSMESSGASRWKRKGHTWESVKGMRSEGSDNKMLCCRVQTGGHWCGGWCVSAFWFVSGSACPRRQLSCFSSSKRNLYLLRKGRSQPRICSRWA